MSVADEFQDLANELAAAIVKGDAAACASVFTKDAVLYSPYAHPARGRAAIEALHRDWTADGVESKSLTVLEAGVDGRLGWCLLAFSEDDPSQSGTTLCVLRKQDDGRWLIHRCSLSSDTPPLA